MQNKLFMTLVLIVAVVLCAANAHAQQTNSAADNKQAGDTAALREKAFDLLKSLAGEISTLQSPENRARLGSNIAWSLWPHDENRARQLFALVQQDINAGLQVPDSTDPKDIKTLMVFLRLRADTVERISKHDPELAYSFFKATELSPEKKLPQNIRESEKSLESQLAKQLAASNPDLSLELARKMLARGFPDDLRLLLIRLNRKHKEQATVLYKEIVRKLGDRNVADEWSVLYFALNLANTFEPPAADESSFRELVNLFIKAMTENGCTKKRAEEDEQNDICRELAPAIPLIAKVDPSRVSKLQHLVNNSGYYSPPSVYYELNELARNGSVDDMLALIAQYPQMEVDIRFQAMQKAWRDGDPVRARKIATEYTGDPERQRMMLARLDQNQANASLNNLQLEEVQKRVSELPNTLAQVIYLTATAERVADNDRKTALKLLNQATELTETIKPGKDQTRAQILLATVYSYQKNNRGLAIMESLMPKLNELVASAARLDGYDTRYLRDGEWNMSAEGELGSMLSWIARNAGYFAWCDFDRAVSVAGQFERPEIRMMAQLKLAQGILAGPPKHSSLDYGGYIH